MPPEPTARSTSSSVPGATPPPVCLARRSRTAIATFLITLVVVLVADLVLKSWSFEHVAGEPVLLDRRDGLTGRFWIPAHDPITVVPGILSFHLTTNEGAVFGIGQGQKWLFVVVSVVATGAILWIFLNSPAGAWLLHVCLASVLAGALGNLYDRMVYSAVRDMLWLLPGVQLPFGWSWPGGRTDAYPWLFNIADVALVLGVGTLLLFTHLGGKPRQKPQSDAG